MHKPVTMTATNRFGLGARPGEPAEAAADPRGWLQNQLDEAVSSHLTAPGLRPAEQAIRDYYQWRARKKQERQADTAPGKPGEGRSQGDYSPREDLAREIEARTRFAMTTDSSFRERLVRFWSNHFTVSITRPPVVATAGAFEREAIRPHVAGRFVDMLLAAETHQAMLFYLDNATSVGPRSVAGKRRDRGLNENLAREILELHTVGVNGGYQQQDVIEFARALTGWTVSGPRDKGVDGKTWFDPRRHEPGGRTVMGRQYAEGGAEQALDVLRDLAERPATARFIATKLARHFIADEPPAEAVSRLERSYLNSGGNLKALSLELIELDHAWGAEQRKFKSPDEFHVSTMRGLGVQDLQLKALRKTYESLGQAPFSAPSPAGWPDETKAWLGADAVEKRFEWSNAVAGKLRGRVDPREFLAASLGEVASFRTQFMVKGADSLQQGLTLSLMSPEFQRR
jgi:uncharacterized protein (DUF1800 family)